MRHALDGQKRRKWRKWVETNGMVRRVSLPTESKPRVKKKNKKRKETRNILKSKFSGMSYSPIFTHSPGMQVT